MLIIGSHVSFDKNTQLLGSLKESLGYGANTFMFYTGAPTNTIRKEIDRDIVKKAHDLNCNVLYSFHMASTEEFLINYYNVNNFDITHIFRYDFPIPKLYDFHKKENQNVDVIVIRAER